MQLCDTEGYLEPPAFGWVSSLSRRTQRLFSLLQANRPLCGTYIFPARTWLLFTPRGTFSVSTSQASRFSRRGFPLKRRLQRGTCLVHCRIAREKVERNLSSREPTHDPSLADCFNLYLTYLCSEMGITTDTTSLPRCSRPRLHPSHSRVQTYFR